MFSSCLFCHASLGANESIEHFPVGKRLAFDTARGRLWAVCPKCARWNLTPLEERWEALEECERAYRNTRKRVSTDNIALVRLRDGTDLIRIGQPLRPEFAAWRYERVITKRRSKLWESAIVGGTGAAALMLAPSLLVSAVVSPALCLLSMQAASVYWSKYDRYWRRYLSIPLEDGTLARMTRTHLHMSMCGLDHAGQLTLRIPYGGHRHGIQDELLNEQQAAFVGQPAHEALRRVVVGVNFLGASRTDVVDAVKLIEVAADQSLLGVRPRDAGPENPVRAFMQLLGANEVQKRAPLYRGMLGEIDQDYRLALEMTLHEADERRAMAGELGALYARWEEAERIAKIADGELTLVPVPRTPN